MKYSIRFFLEKRKDKDGNLIIQNVPLLMEVTFRGLRYRQNAGVRLNVEQWVPESETMKRNNFTAQDESSTEVNAKINNLKSEVGRIMARCDVDGITPTISYLRSELSKDNTEKVVYVSDIIDEFTSSVGLLNSWSESTYKKFKTLKNRLDEFKPKLEFADLTEETLGKFVQFLLTEKKYINKTVAKTLHNLTWFLNYATKKGYNRLYDYKDFKPKLKGVGESTILFLKWPDLMHLYNLEVKKDYLERVRDVFCFCCFTGLRHSDVYNLKWSNVKDGHIEIVTVKTEDPIVIDLNQYAKAILDKYRDVHLNDEKCLPVISNQKMNDYLKELGQLAELNEPVTTVFYRGAERIEETKPMWSYLTTHMGRKTFTSSAVFFGVPAEVLMKWTGHKSHEMLEKYYDIIDEQRKTEMEKFNR